MEQTTYQVHQFVTYEMFAGNPKNGYSYVPYVT